jgi:hypothetical protein
MPIVQIRDVREDTVRRLKAKAALQGVSLSDYLRAELDRLAGRPTMKEYLELVRGLRLDSPISGAEAIRLAREEMDEKWERHFP